MTMRILVGDARDRLRELPDESVHCVVSSPPYYGLRDYGVAGQIGLEPSPAEYVGALVAVFREVRRVLRKDGTLWLNLGDSYASGGTGGYSDKSTLAGFTNATTKGRVMNGAPIPRRIVSLKPKDLIGIPWLVAFALRADGWWLRQDIIWSKPNPMPESVTDRCTKAHEYLFLLSKSERYYYDQDAIKQPAAPPGPRNPRAYYGGRMPSEQRGEAGNQPSKLARGNGDTFLSDTIDPSIRNKRSVWTVTTQPYAEAHFATFPPALIEPCILAGTSEKGVCAKCGAPWARVVEKERTFQSGSGRSGNMPIGKNGPALQGGGATLDIRRGPCVETVTTGWSPSCACNTATTVPAIVLDPFFGAGTTGIVADRLGRDCIGIELNPAYAEMTRARLVDDAGMFANVEVAA